ncbi:PREDICTED: uncharacterized protein LOC108575776 [Habropoda laboriosa]|uniref:uncharacterized protein LOC108575776 n=1 Tax=Habropoda laboriosa TaxID=597456 RepID=UPI00083D4D0D|nr:PREDICTED: uncharacterized protein LOC108575776 [Habropoda laboriosa]
MEKHFASLKLLDTDTDWKLTEAVSYSNLPSSHRMAVKQIYQSDSKFNLVRQYSCEESFDQDANARQLQVSEILQTDDDKYNTECQMTNSYSDSFWRFSTSNGILKAAKFLPNKASNEVGQDKVENISAVNESKFSLPCTVANADVENKTNRVSFAESRNSGKANTEIKRTDTTKEKEKNENTYKDLKKRFRPLIVKKKNPTNKKMNVYYCSCLTVCIIPAIVVMFALFFNLDQTERICNCETLLSNASLELQQKIHGQEKAISRIIRYFDENYSHLKVLCIIGGTGVGKSYTAKIITKHFPLKNDIFIYDAVLDRSVDLAAQSSLGLQQLLVVENLKLKHLNIFSDIIDVLRKTKDKCVTVVAIFNVEEVNSSLERKVDLVQSENAILQAMADKKIDLSIVPYEPLNEEALEICITEAALTSGLTLTSDQVNEIKQSLILSGSGCKKAYAKVQVIH